MRDNTYPYEMMPLLYAIIKSTNGDLPQAHRLIQEGKNACPSVEEESHRYKRCDSEPSSCNNKGKETKFNFKNTPSESDSEREPTNSKFRQHHCRPCTPPLDLSSKFSTTPNYLPISSTSDFIKQESSVPSSPKNSNLDKSPQVEIQEDSQNNSPFEENFKENHSLNISLQPHMKNLSFSCFEKRISAAFPT